MITRAKTSQRPLVKQTTENKKTTRERVAKTVPNSRRQRSHRVKASNYPLPSPPSSTSPVVAFAPKRKRSPSENTHLDEHAPSAKRRFLAEDKRKASDREDYNPVAHWVFNKNWPQDFGVRGLDMADSSTGAKRRSESTHRSVYIERLEAQGVFIKTSSLIQESSKALCVQLQEERGPAPEHFSFPSEQFPRVLERIQNLNESRIQRDVLPRVVPSAEILHFCGEPNLDYIGDEVNARWIRCATMGGKIPQPDYVAGLLPKAFTKEEREKLKNYSSPERPFHFTPELCFPFLVCEIKTGERGMSEADRQNIHSASIAVRSVVELYKAAYGTSNPEMIRDLYGQVLAFSVSHNHNLAFLYGHFAIPADDSPDTLEYCRCEIAMISLSMNYSAGSKLAYDFVRNVYDIFAPEHRRRIKAATTFLPAPTARTGLSFSASDLALTRTDSQQDSQDETSFEVPNLPASALKTMEQQKQQMERQLELQRQESKEKEGRMERQMEKQMDQQRQQMEKQMERQRQQMDQQRQQMDQQRQQMDQQRQQMDQQRQQMEKQMEQQRQESKEKEEKMEKQMKEKEERMERQMEEMLKLLRTFQK